MSRMTVTHDDHGELVRLELDQVGWRGQSGRFYALDDDEGCRTEPGSFSPVWETAHADRVIDLVPECVIDPPAVPSVPGEEPKP